MLLLYFVTERYNVRDEHVSCLPSLLHTGKRQNQVVAKKLIEQKLYNLCVCSQLFSILTVLKLFFYHIRRTNWCKNARQRNHVVQRYRWFYIHLFNSHSIYGYKHAAEFVHTIWYILRTTGRLQGTLKLFSLKLKLLLLHTVNYRVSLNKKS